MLFEGLVYPPAATRDGNNDVALLRLVALRDIHMYRLQETKEAVMTSDMYSACKHPSGFLVGSDVAAARTLGMVCRLPVIVIRLGRATPAHLARVPERWRSYWKVLPF